MSAIHGVLRFDGQPVSERDLERQANALAHRGADRRAQWRENIFGLGHLLARVTREDGSDAQPVRADGAVLAADLRIDNREDLAAALDIDPADLPLLPDSALLMKAYARWGTDCVTRLVGDFAFALWDGKARELILARDPMGQRHLHYHAGKDAFVFASEVKGLWPIDGVPQEPNLPALARQLAVDRAPSGGATAFKDIFGLEGGTLMRVSASGAITTRRYWEPRADPKHVGHDEAYYVKAYREVLGEAVACRVRRARQPAALMLGGGFDSGAIAGLAGLAAKKLICVASVGSDDTRGVRRWALLLARHMPHIDLHLVTRDGIDVTTNIERNFLEGGEPYSPNRYASAALTAEAARAGARVIMDGHGGDYTLNPRGTGWLARRLKRGEVSLFTREFRATRRHSGMRLAQLFSGEIASQLLPPRLVRAWRRFRSGLRPFGPAAPLTQALFDAAGPIETPVAARSEDPLAQMAEILRRQQSGHAIGGALLAAAHGLEFTQPYHDTRVIELALAIPESLYVKDGRDRVLARRALADIYPPEYQSRGRANDALIPDFPQMAERVKPELLGEIDRMAADESLARYFDFPRLRRMLASGPITPRNETAARQAIRVYLYARFLEWQRRGNRK